MQNLKFYRHEIAEAAARCTDAGLLDLVLKMLMDAEDTPPAPIVLQPAKRALGRKVDALDEYQARVVIGFVDGLFRHDAPADDMEVAA